MAQCDVQTFADAARRLAGNLRAVNGVWAVGIQLALATFVGLCAKPSRASRALTIAGITAALCLPFFIPHTEPVTAFVAGMIGVVIAMRGVELIDALAAMGVRQRLWHIFALFDSRAARPCLPQWNLVVLGRVGVCAALGAISLTVGILVPSHLPAPWGRVLRWAAGDAFSLLLFETVMGTLRVAYERGGIRPPPLHDRPHLARSVGEFWSRRWNRIVGGWLRARIFLPLARARSRPLALVGTFAFSALIHAYLVAAPLGRNAVVSMSLFFLLQGIAVLVEHRLHVQRWRPRVARAWTLSILIASSPLFVMPMWRLLGL